MHLLKSTDGSLAEGVCWYQWVRKYRDYQSLDEVELQLGVEVTETEQPGEGHPGCCYPPGVSSARE